MESLKIFRNLLFLGIPLIILSSCGGGSTTLEATDGSKLLFKNRIFKPNSAIINPVKLINK